MSDKYIEVDIWYGAGEKDLAGPIDGIIISDNIDNLVEYQTVKFIDVDLLKQMSWHPEIDGNGEYIYFCKKLQNIKQVYHGDYAWSLKQ